MNVKLSDKPCLFCGTRENTVAAKNKETQANVCPAHLIELLKKAEQNALAVSAENSRLI